MPMEFLYRGSEPVRNGKALVSSSVTSTDSNYVPEAESTTIVTDIFETVKSATSSLLSAESSTVVPEIIGESTQSFDQFFEAAALTAEDNAAVVLTEPTLIQNASGLFQALNETVTFNATSVLNSVSAIQSGTIISNTTPVSESLNFSRLMASRSEEFSKVVIDQVSNAVREAFEKSVVPEASSQDNLESMDKKGMAKLVRVVLQELQDEAFDPTSSQCEESWANSLEYASNFVALAAFGCFAVHKAAEVAYKFVFRRVYSTLLSGKVFILKFLFLWTHIA